MTDEQGNAVECKECADVPETPPSSTGYGWCPKVELKLDEPEATDEEMEELDNELDRTISEELAKRLELYGASDVLKEAAHIVSNGRRSDYGHPIENFDRIRRGWEVIFGIPVSRRQVAQAMAWTKIARDVETPKRDNAVDLAGYAGLMEEVR